MKNIIAKIEDALCIIDDFEYLDTDKMEHDDFIRYASIMVKCAEELRPLRDKYSSEIADAVAAQMFADSFMEGFEAYLDDCEENDDDEPDF